MERNRFEAAGIGRRDFLTRSAIIVTGSLFGVSRLIAGQETGASAGPADPKLIEDLIAANRILAQQGINDAFGHVSVRHNRNPNHYILARSLAPELVTPDDLIEYDLESNPVNNLKGRAQYTERFIHGEIYKARPDVNAVVHNHSPEIVPFTVSSVALRPIYHMAFFIGDGLPIYEIREAAGMTDMLVSDSIRAGALAKTLGNRPAALMRGHGIAVVGPSLPFAVGRSIYLSLDAKIQSQTMGLGGSIKYLDPEEVKKRIAGGENGSYERPWEIWRKKALEK